MNDRFIEKVKARSISTPLQMTDVELLKAGDEVLLNGTIYTARDAAHNRFIQSVENNEPLPFDIRNAVIYYVGPTPAKPGEIIGSAGPTTSYRMDDYSIPLIRLGLKGMIGKGNRSLQVIESMKQYSAVYFTAIGGAGALIRSSVISSKVIAYEDLGAEAVRELVVKDFPAIVTIDIHGNSLYETEPPKYKK